MKIERFLLLITFTFILCFSMNCGSSEAKLSDDAIERMAQKKFNELRDTLAKQATVECDSLFKKEVQANVDSLLFEYFKEKDKIQ